MPSRRIIDADDVTALVDASTVAPVSTVIAGQRVDGHVRLDAIMQSQGSGGSSQGVNVTVPGDFPTLQAAVSALAAQRPRYAASSGNRLVIEIQSGFQPSSGIRVQEMDASHIEIRSVDPVVTVASDFSGRLIDVGSYSRGPVLACVIDMAGRGEVGYWLNEQSFGHATIDGGIINAGGTTIYLNRKSEMNIQGGQGPLKPWYGAGLDSVWLDHDCRLHARYCDFSGPARHVINCQAMNQADLEGCDMRNAGDVAVLAHYNSTLHLRFIQGGGSGGAFVLSQGGARVTVFNSDLFGSADNMLEASTGFIHVENVSIHRAGYLWTGSGTPDPDNASEWQLVAAGADGINLNDCGSITGRAVTVSNSANRGLFLSRGCDLRLRNATTRNNGSEGLRASNGSRAVIQTLASGGNGGRDVRSLSGSDIRLWDVTRIGGGSMDYSPTPGAVGADGTAIWLQQ